MGIGIPLFLRRDTMARGRAIYRKRVRPTAHPARKGEFVAIDVRSGEFEIDPNDTAATRRLRERLPDAVIWMERIGYKATFSFAGGLPQEDD